MKRFARFVNPCFFTSAPFPAPPTASCVTVSAGRRTIAKPWSAWQVISQNKGINWAYPRGPVAGSRIAPGVVAQIAVAAGGMAFEHVARLF